MNQYWSSIGGVLVTIGNQYWSLSRPVLVDFSAPTQTTKGPPLGEPFITRNTLVIGEIKQEASPFARSTSAQWVAGQNGVGARRYSYQGGVKAR